MKKQLSCIDCAVKSCQRGDGRYPDFCVTTHLDPQTLKDALNCYEEEENHRATLAAIFREHGFEVFGVCCKAGAVPKTDLGIDEKCSAVGKAACNPILQAKVLNEAKTDLNVVVGLCVGHDSLFYKYSDAPGDHRGDKRPGAGPQSGRRALHGKLILREAAWKRR